IGTTNPSEKLTVIGNGAFADGSTTSTLTKNSLILGQTSSAALGKFYVDSSGNVNASGTLNILGTTGTSTFAGDVNIGNGGLIYDSSSGTTYITSIETTNLNFDDDAGIITWVDMPITSAAANTVMSYTASIDDSQLLTLYGLSDGSGAVLQNSLGVAVATSVPWAIFDVNNKFTVASSTGNTNVSGTLRIYGGATTGGLQISATDATTTLTSYITDGAGASAFAFNSSATMTSGTDRMLAVFQNNGTNKVLISAGGNVYAKNSFIANSSDYGIGDVAEFVNLKEGETVEFGDVLVVDEAGLNQYKKSTIAHAKNVAGVVSDTGKFVIGADGPGRAPLALAGLVKVKVTDENGPIAVGDYLVSASKPGYAMKYNSTQGQAAGLVGMALEPLASGDGVITIMVNKGFVDGAAQTTQNITNLSVVQNAEGYLQMTQAADLDMAGFRIINVKGLASLGGLWSIGDDGEMAAKELKVDKMQSKQITVEKDADAKKSAVGEGTIVAGATSVEIENEMASTTAKIFITFRGNAGGGWWISKVEQGKFEVSLSQPTVQDVSFDYWIIDTITNTDNDQQTTDTPVISPVISEPTPDPVQDPAPTSESQPVVEPETTPIQEPAPEPEQQQPIPEVQPESQLVVEPETTPIQEPEPAQEPVQEQAMVTVTVEE
ncbi:MAG: hypothetical protein WC430_04075, partial [Patescibacteria group bacterium]